MISLQQHFLRNSNYNKSPLTTKYLNRKNCDPLKMKTFRMHRNRANFIAFPYMY